MSYRISILPRAADDYTQMYDFIAERSPTRATRWEDSFDKVLSRLAANPLAFGFAPERDEVNYELRQFLFGTKSGLTYRGVFFIQEDTVFVVRVRGPGQPPLSADELQT